MAELVPVQPFDMIVFGATGDLARRKILPALFHRWCDGQIPQTSRILAAAREDMTTEEFLERAREFINGAKGEDKWSAFCERVSYTPVDAKGEAPGWGALKSALDPQASKARLFYLALPPSIYGSVCAAIAAHGLNTPGSRIVLEKPIGHDFHSARLINEAVGQAFDEDAIFRIDHYLGKETVQNLLVLRFANMLFEPVWNAAGVDHVQITVAETLGAGKRAAYYDRAGALRDMVQNHLLQLLCLVAMEPPASLEGDAVRAEKLKVLRALRLIGPDEARTGIVRGQYGAGLIGQEAVEGYGEEVGEATRTETFVALRADIDNWRWSGVPFYLRTGKRMATRRSEIVIQFKPVPHDVIQADAGRLQPNRLVIRLQPDEGVKLMLMTKDPGPGGMRLRYVPLNLSYAEAFEADYPDAYERLLMAVVRGNLALFMRRDEVEAAWRWTDAVIAAWREAGLALHPYPAGTDGPPQALQLMARDGRDWYDGHES
ncbi:glucose-6-phosphate dehydrogenase [Alkalicaulis satelles]|uniref:Glucose-6-phosphate 1-dehydrogenase n=1 Tax=Alkalicaulis satelles TaxID=2609175 RepID=A0A5M6ZJ65_9PROT|nr:glucose-6-phosphate dehydrogenase [Alkalicaulis satelles]KAA5802271.1 glucose-6-phosphate dehydrogenase [Alkalicaulis satelles]